MFVYMDMPLVNMQEQKLSTHRKQQTCNNRYMHEQVLYWNLVIVQYI